MDLEFGAGNEASADRVAREDGRGEPRDETDSPQRTAENRCYPSAFRPVATL